MTQPRLLADFAAVPTPRERRHARAANRAAQLGMFEHEHQDDEPAPCPVCAGPHPEHDCTHGSAPVLPDLTFTTHCRHCRAETNDYRDTPTGPICRDHVECAWRRAIADGVATR